mmetsp:Transcript_12198/g.28723  ORF Transcript_12198/g.28723 Transcript_12198/m.28723 type:complete len:142 (-) Transcript_12198:990-1415(-)
MPLDEMYLVCSREPVGSNSGLIDDSRVGSSCQIQPISIYPYISAFNNLLLLSSLLLFVLFKFASVNCISSIGLGRVVNFPAAGGENMFVSIKPSSFNNLSWMTLVFFDSTIQRPQSNVFVYVKVEQRTRLASCTRGNEVVK